MEDEIKSTTIVDNTGKNKVLSISISLMLGLILGMGIMWLFSNIVFNEQDKLGQNTDKNLEVILTPSLSITQVIKDVLPKDNNKILDQNIVLNGAFCEVYTSQWKVCPLAKDSSYTESKDGKLTKDELASCMQFEGINPEDLVCRLMDLNSGEVLYSFTPVDGGYESYSFKLASMRSDRVYLSQSSFSSDGFGVYTILEYNFQDKKLNENVLTFDLEDRCINIDFQENKPISIFWEQAKGWECETTGISDRKKAEFEKFKSYFYASN